MIPVEDVYNSLLTILREDKRGLAVSPDEYNRLAKIVNERIYKKKVEEFEGSIDNIDTLAGFKVIDDTETLAGSTITLPSDYYQMIGKPRIVNNSSETRRLDLVSQLELDEREEDYLTKPSETYPVYTLAELDGTDVIMHVYPTTITGDVTFSYLKEATVPFYDYYLANATLVVTYMDTATAPALSSSYTYRDGTIGDGVTTFTSLSADWDWGEDEMELILSMFCQLLGIAYPEQFLLEAGNLEETKTA